MRRAARTAVRCSRRAPPQRRRPPSSTSSESRGDQEAKRLERHRRWMYEKDPTYKAYVDQVESDLRDAEVRRQGEIMARALQDSLDRAFKENKLMPIPSTGKASFPPPTPPGGKASAPADHPAGSNGTATPPRAPASDGGSPGGGPKHNAKHTTPQPAGGRCWAPGSAARAASTTSPHTEAMSPIGHNMIVTVTCICS